MLRIASLALGALLLAGCSTFPDAIATQDEDALVSYSQVKNNILKYCLELSWIC